MEKNNNILEEDDDAFLESINALLGDEPTEREMEDPPAPPELPKQQENQLPRRAKKENNQNV